jgi:hypothetical protein
MDHVGDAEGIDLHRLAAIVHRLRPILLTAGIDLVNRNDFAWFWLGQQIIVLSWKRHRAAALLPKVLPCSQGWNKRAASHRRCVQRRHLGALASLGLVSGKDHANRPQLIAEG